MYFHNQNHLHIVLYCHLLAHICRKQYNNNTIVDLKENQQNLQLFLKKIKKHTFYKPENNQFRTNVDIIIKV